MQFPFRKDFLRLLSAPLDMCLHISFAERLISSGRRFRASCQPLIKVYVSDLETIFHEKLITARERNFQRSKSDFVAKLPTRWYCCAVKAKKFFCCNAIEEFLKTRKRFEEKTAATRKQLTVIIISRFCLCHCLWF